MLTYDQVEILQEAVNAAIRAEPKAHISWLKELQRVAATLEAMLVTAEAKFPGNEPIIFVGDWEVNDPTF